MTETDGGFSRRRAIADRAAIAIAIIALVGHILLANQTTLIVGVYAFLFGTSTTVVTYALTQLTGIRIETDSSVEEDTGWLIGRCENVLVLSLVLVGEYTALSVIFAAKSWVRRDDTASGNTTYYLAGTLVNFTYSIVVGLGTVRLLAFL